MDVAITARPSEGGLQLLIDSTGVNLGIDAHTQDTRTTRITDNRQGDAPVLPEPLAQIPADERMHSVSADGVYAHFTPAMKRSPAGKPLPSFLLEETPNRGLMARP